MFCHNCNSDIPKLNLTDRGLLHLWCLRYQDLSIFSVKYLIDSEKKSHKIAKQITAHFNPIYGECHNCNFDQLHGRNVQCPRCNAFNYNRDAAPPFNQEFCSVLASKIRFSELNDVGLAGFWCDGIDCFPEDLSNLHFDNLIDDNQITTRAWIGKSGQQLYKMTIILGDLALSTYKSRGDLAPCIPDSSCASWIVINPRTRTIILNLK